MSGSSKSLALSNPTVTYSDMNNWSGDYDPGRWEYLKAQFRAASEWSIPYLALNSALIQQSESDAEQLGINKIYKNEEEWKESPYYREGIRFNPNGMTQVRAEAYAANYDARRQREEIISSHLNNTNSKFFDTVLGFGAGLIANAPDPLNLIPLSVGLKGAKLGSATFGQIAKSAAIRGAGVGAGVGLTSSTIAAISLNSQGEEIGYQDIMLNTIFGAVLGMGFATGGGYVGRNRIRNQMRGQNALLHDWLEVTGNDVQPTAIAENLEGMRAGRTDAFINFERAGNRVVEQYQLKQDFLDTLRTNLSAEDKLRYSQAFELALRQLSDGVPVDVSPVLKGSNMLKNAEKVLNDFRAKLKAATPLEEQYVREVREANQRLSNLDTQIAMYNEWIESHGLNDPEIRSLLQGDELAPEYRRVRNTIDSLEKEKIRIQEVKNKAQENASNHWKINEELRAKIYEQEKHVSNKQALDQSELDITARRENIVNIQREIDSGTDLKPKEIQRLQSALKAEQDALAIIEATQAQLLELYSGNMTLDKLDWTPTNPLGESASTSPTSRVDDPVIFDNQGRSFEEKIAEENNLIDSNTRNLMADLDREADMFRMTDEVRNVVENCVLSVVI